MIRFASDKSEPFAFLPQEIDEFKALMREECGVELSEQEAWDRATQLVNLYRMLLGPIPEDREMRGQEREDEPSTSTPPRQVEPVAQTRDQPRHQLSLGI